MMREKCRDIERIIENWKESGTLSRPHLDTVKDHIDECPRCRTIYTPLIPFLEHDAKRAGAGTPVVKTGPPSPSSEKPLGEEFTERVMQEVERTRGRPRSGSTVRVLTAAAALLAAVVLVIRLAVPGMGPEQPERTAQTTQYVEVHFTLTAPDAESVTLVGDFTEWETSEIQLKDPNNDGLWEATVPLRKDNVYLYNFVIDGEKWVVDPDSIIQVDDEFGGESSLLKL
jgi:hypothetical protein